LFFCQPFFLKKAFKLPFFSIVGHPGNNVLIDSVFPFLWNIRWYLCLSMVRLLPEITILFNLIDKYKDMAIENKGGKVLFGLNQLNCNILPEFK